MAGSALQFRNPNSLFCPETPQIIKSITSTVLAPTLWKKLTINIRFKKLLKTCMENHSENILCLSKCFNAVLLDFVLSLCMLSHLFIALGNCCFYCILFCFASILHSIVFCEGSSNCGFERSYTNTFIMIICASTKKGGWILEFLYYIQIIVHAFERHKVFWAVLHALHIQWHMLTWKM